jgi:hypothetical protein
MHVCVHTHTHTRKQKLLYSPTLVTSFTKESVCGENSSILEGIALCIQDYKELTYVYVCMCVCVRERESVSVCVCVCIVCVCVNLLSPKSPKVLTTT